MRSVLVLSAALRTSLSVSCLALGILMLCPAGANGADQGSCGVRVLSYNIRFGTAKDGENHWDRRKEALVATIKAWDPDLLGTQETLGFQRDYLAAELPRYEVLGVGRTDGRESGEMMALYYKKDRFEKLDGGHFWLSETPDAAGSKSWDSSLPRMVTWVKLSDRRNPGAPPIVFFNTHFDHLGVQARLESARLLRRQVMTLGQGCLVIVTGDFNSGEGSDPYQRCSGPSKLTTLPWSTRSASLAPTGLHRKGRSRASRPRPPMARGSIGSASRGIGTCCVPVSTVRPTAVTPPQIISPSSPCCERKSLPGNRRRVPVASGDSIPPP